MIVPRDIGDGRGEPACWHNGRTFVYWSHVPTQPWQTQRWLASLEPTLTPGEFRRLVHCDFSANETSYVQPEWWAACYDPTIPPLDKRTPIVAAVDASLTHDATAVVAVSKHPTRRDAVAVRHCSIWNPASEPGPVIDHNASLAPYGYQRTEDGEDVIDPEAAEVVTLAFESYATGQYSDTTLADLLNRKGYKPSGRARSGRWTREGVRYLLNNPFYIGMVRHGDDLYPGQHEPIISQELWDQVQALRAKRGQGKGAGKRPDRVYLLARIARCHDCGLKLVAQTSNHKSKGLSYQYCYCPSYRRSVDCGVGKHFIHGYVLEWQMADLVKRLTLPEDWRDRLEKLAELREERGQVEGKRRYVQGKLRRLRDLYLEGDIEKVEYGRQKAELQAQLDALRMPQQPDIEEAGETLEELGAVWASASKRMQRQMLRTIFEEVRVDVAGQRIVCVNGWSPFVPLFRMDGLREHGGCFYAEEEDQEAGPTD